MSAAQAAGARYLLDTNIVGAAIRGQDAALLQRLVATAIGEVAISSVTLAEMEYGWRRAGQPPRLRRSIDAFVLRVDVLPWDDAAARCYGACRAAWEAAGLSLADLDMMSAAHAVCAGATLVSRDRAFGHVAGRPPVPEAGRLRLEVW